MCMINSLGLLDRVSAVLRLGCTVSGHGCCSWEEAEG